MATTPASGSRAASKRIKLGPRTYLACLSCKSSKLKIRLVQDIRIITNESQCDNNSPACANCVRYGTVCLYEDPISRRQLPRNYVENLEQRLAYVESLLQHQQSAYHFQVQDQLPPSQAPPTNETPSDTNALVEHEDPEDLHDLASKVGTLSLNAAGAEPHYLGSSSTFAFARLIKPVLSQIGHSVSGYEQEEAVDNGPPDTCPLPDPKTAASLSNAYFDNIHTQYPFLSEPDFRAWESAILFHGGEWLDEQTDPAPFFFLNMVYAVGALLIPQTEYTAERLYASAMCFIEPLISTDTMNSIQAILCCATYSLRSSVGASHWKLAGLAVRQCVDLGYHRSMPRIDPVADLPRTELRRRIFWSAYSMECASCIHLGRPLSLHFNEIDAELPMDADDLYITTGGTAGRRRLSKEDPPTNVTRGIFSIRLRVLQGRIQTALYSDTRVHGSRSREHLETVAELRQELEAWKSELPEVLPPTGPALSLFMTPDWPLFVYNQAILQVYRPQLTSQEDITAKSGIIDMCVSLAADLCHAYRRQYFGKPTTYTWGALHELFLAGLTYVYCIRADPATRARLGYQNISKTCTDCTITFVILAERWKDAAPYRDLFEAISSSTLALVAQAERAQPPPQDQHDIVSNSHLGGLSGDPSFSDMFATFTDEVDAPAQIDTMLDAILTEWTQYNEG